MTIYQTSFFMEDVKHYTKLINEYKNSSNHAEIRRALYKLDKLRGAAYSDKVAAKANQAAKTKFYYREV